MKGLGFPLALHTNFGEPLTNATLLGKMSCLNFGAEPFPDSDPEKMNNILIINNTILSWVQRAALV